MAQPDRSGTGAHDRQDAGSGQVEGYPAEAARQGHIVLRSRARRRIFIAGLAGFVLLSLLLAALL